MSAVDLFIYGTLTPLATIQIVFIVYRGAAVKGILIACFAEEADGAISGRVG